MGELLAQGLRAAELAQRLEQQRLDARAQTALHVVQHGRGRLPAAHGLQAQRGGFELLPQRDQMRFAVAAIAAIAATAALIGLVVRARSRRRSRGCVCRHMQKIRNRREPNALGQSMCAGLKPNTQASTFAGNWATALL